MVLILVGVLVEYLILVAGIIFEILLFILARMMPTKSKVLQKSKGSILPEA